MKRFLLLCVVASQAMQSVAQDLILDFESLSLPQDTFWNGSDMSGAYKEPVSPVGGDTFVAINAYDTAFGGFWSGGYAISTMRDDTTQGFTNLYSSIAAGGESSDAYAVVSAFNHATLRLTGNVSTLPGIPSLPRFMGMYLTNSTYAYFSMLNGDGIAKQFGGASGDDPDYFFIRFSFYYSATDAQPYDSVDFYLADFRSPDNSEDYILDDWVYVDLNDFPAFEYPGAQVRAKLYSSDIGAFGINTPAFFCMDNLEIDFPTGVENVPDQQTISVSVWQETIEVRSEEKSDIQLYSLSGRLVARQSGAFRAVFPSSSLPQGIYVVESISASGRETKKVWRW